MKKNYYLGEGPYAETLISGAKERWQRANDARDSLLLEYSADGLLSRGSEIYGLVFKERKDLTFLKVEAVIDGKFGYSPRLNSKQGKELKNRLQSPDVQFDVSSFILNELKLNRVCISATPSGLVMDRSSVDFSGKILLLVIPDGEDCDPMPEIPTWFRQVKESEWLAAQDK